MTAINMFKFWWFQVSTPFKYIEIPRSHPHPPQDPLTFPSNADFKTHSKYYNIRGGADN